MQDLTFIATPLRLMKPRRGDIFAAKNDKTVSQTLMSGKYRGLAEEVTERHADKLDMPLGSFLMVLKVAGDPLHRRFLNSYGDLEYCAFELVLGASAEAKGCTVTSTAAKSNTSGVPPPSVNAFVRGTATFPQKTALSMGKAPTVCSTH
jgi:hypothetical protein